MDQDETIALFEHCEAVRADTKARALAEGRPEDEARILSLDAARAVWNEWAHERIAERDYLESADLWQVERSGDGPLEPLNEETRLWINAAKADFSGLRFVMRIEADEIRVDLGEVKSRPSTWQPVKAVAYDQDDISFAGFIFPGPVDFEETQFTATTHLSDAEFMGDACFNKSQFIQDACLDRARFHAAAYFQDAQFFKKALLKEVRFSGVASFEKTRFWQNVWFDGSQLYGNGQFSEAVFSGEVRFERAAFASEADFRHARFVSIAWFDQVHFADNLRLDDARFESNGWFNDVCFDGNAQFHGVQFLIADFQRSQFTRQAHFKGAIFLGDVDFRQVSFAADAHFGDASFNGAAIFHHAEFARTAHFANASFAQPVTFRHTGFCGEVLFTGAQFYAPADFQLTVFPQYTSFKAARFKSHVSFNAINSARAFDLSDADFWVAPDFVQAHFTEAPRLDNLIIRQRLVMGGHEFGDGAFWKSGVSWPVRALLGLQRRLFAPDKDAPAHWRALKRLARHGLDRDREHLFASNEIRAARFVSDWPLPVPVWSFAGWAGFTRFWLGCFYGLLSNYGRSIILPALWWAAILLISANIYFGQHLDRQRSGAASAKNRVEAFMPWSQEGLLLLNAGVTPCQGAGDNMQTELLPLGKALDQTTDVRQEALYLALRAGLVFPDMTSQNTYRSYGCLFGLPKGRFFSAPIIPSRTAFTILIQQVLSILFLFLFILGLRNKFRAIMS